MPDPEKLPPEKKAKLLGCISGKNKAWREKHKKATVPQEVRERHFRDCAKKLGYG